MKLEDLNLLKVGDLVSVRSDDPTEPECIETAMVYTEEPVMCCGSPCIKVVFENGSLRLECSRSILTKIGRVTW